jgi:hypothetical protein
MYDTSVFALRVNTNIGKRVPVRVISLSQYAPFTT